MDIHRRPVKPLSGKPHNERSSIKASDDDELLLPLYLTNSLFFAMFFSVTYFLLHRWREKIRNGIPLHVLSFSELFAMVALMVSFIYLLGFFGIQFFKNNDDFWVDTPCVRQNVSEKTVTGNENGDDPLVVRGNDSKKTETEVELDDDEVIIKAVAEGKMQSYSLEAKLGDCKRAAFIRKEALQRSTGKSLEGLPLEGFDYESILGQCCEMPIGYIQIPVGIAGPLLLDGREYSVPMATTEGCLVASTNRGCKAIHVSGGATSVLFRDGMTRAPVVRFGSAKRAAELKFFVEDSMNFEMLSEEVQDAIH